MASLVELAPGSLFAGDFRVVRLLTEGGMGAVYVVEQLSTGKQRALKLMHPNLVHDDRQRQRFVQEAKIGARIESDHVVEVLGAGIEPIPWLAMELLQGETLDERIEKRGPLSRADTAEVFRQLGHALVAAHDAGIVHRDLKPENIFLSVPRREGIPFLVKILDFGIAKLVAESGRTTQAIGSPLWMAPEQTNTEAPITASTDVWALGLIAYTCLTGQSYWRGAHAEITNPMSIVMEICFDPLVSASERAGEYGVAHLLPEGFDEWFAQCVTRDTEARFKNARPCRVALERLLVGRSADASGSFSAPDLPSSEPRSGAPSFDAPELDLPKPKPKAEPKSIERPAAKPAQPAPAKPAEPPKPLDAPRPAPRVDLASTLGSGVRPSLPQARITGSRASLRSFERPAAAEKPFPWRNVAIGGVVMLAALAGAQRFFWTRGPEQPPAPASAAPHGAKPSAPAAQPSSSDSSASSDVACPAGMAKLPSGELAPGKAVGPFCLDVTEVTVKAYAACVKSGKCTAPGASGNWAATSAEDKKLRNQSCNGARADRQDHPVNCVDWSQADAYCKSRGKRLPTEVELEWAARGGASKWKDPWGFQSPDVQLCWSSFTKRTGTCPVGSYPKGANQWGVQDLAGNVREWTDTSAGPDRVHCGGDWTDKGELFALGYCGHAPKTARSGFVGFRCAL